MIETTLKNDLDFKKLTGEQKRLFRNIQKGYKFSMQTSNFYKHSAKSNARCSPTEKAAFQGLIKKRFIVNGSKYLEVNE